MRASASTLLTVPKSLQVHEVTYKCLANELGKDREKKSMSNELMWN